MNGEKQSGPSDLMAWLRLTFMTGWGFFAVQIIGRQGVLNKRKNRNG